MFSVYGETGRLFKGAMEELRHVEAVRAVSRSRAVEPIGRFPASVPSPQTTHSTSAAPHSPLAAYVQTGALQAPRRPLTRVADVMSHGVITVSAASPVLQAWQQLAEHGVSQAPAVDAQGLLVGLLTRAELLKLERLPLPGADAQAWRTLLAQPVSTIMWTPVPAVARETDIRHVARVLLDTHLPGLPVVNDAGMVEGFVSRTDILRAVVHDPPLDLWS
jgi:CBS-domain-containing membrane protein